MSYCPKWDEDKNCSVCPECGGELDDEEDCGEDELAYCGPACGSCGWHHCGGCI